jgi:hypothetical protein
VAPLVDRPLAAVGAEHYRQVVGRFGDHRHRPRQHPSVVVQVGQQFNRGIATPRSLAHSALPAGCRLCPPAASLPRIRPDESPITAEEAAAWPCKAETRTAAPWPRPADRSQHSHGRISPTGSRRQNSPRDDSRAQPRISRLSDQRMIVVVAGQRPWQRLSAGRGRRDRTLTRGAIRVIDSPTEAFSRRCRRNRYRAAGPLADPVSQPWDHKLNHYSTTNSRKQPDLAGRHRTLTRSAPGRIHAGQGLFPQVVAGDGFEPS